MHTYQTLQNALKISPKKWLITGVAGFIGSNLLETLLKLDQFVVGLDNFSTGKSANLAEVQSLVTKSQYSRFKFIKADICNLQDCYQASQGIDYVLHQAALGSVPRSIENPMATHQANIDGFVNMLIAARDNKVKNFVYASSSSAYGDHPDLPKVEEKIGNPLSPYALSKYVNELYAQVFQLNYQFNCIGLRYFNVFGKRQDANGAYAAVIPKWILAMSKNKEVYIYGDGQTSRDFCYIDNAIQANLLAALNQNPKANNQIYNVAVGNQTSLNQLYQILLTQLKPHFAHLENAQAIYQDFRKGDVRHSKAAIGKIEKLLFYCPQFDFDQGISQTINWYLQKIENPNSLNQ